MARSKKVSLKKIKKEVKEIKEPLVETIVETKESKPALFCPRCGEEMILIKKGDRWSSTEYKCENCGAGLAQM